MFEEVLGCVRSLIVRRAVFGALAAALTFGWTAAASRAVDFEDVNNNVCEGQGCFNGSLLTNGAFDNDAFGPTMMESLTSGDSNIGAGTGALFNITTGSSNIAIGHEALDETKTGSSNVAAGDGALEFNNGGSNVAIGQDVLRINTSAGFNTGVGTNALIANSTGHSNLAVGFQALGRNTTGSFNLALGPNAGLNLTTGSNDVDLANSGRAGESGKIRIGTAGKQTAAFLAGVTGVTIPGPTQAVVVNANGQLGTAPAPAVGASTGAQVRRQQRQIDQLIAQNKRLAADVAQLRGVLLRGR